MILGLLEPDPVGARPVRRARQRPRSERGATTPVVELPGTHWHRYVDVRWPGTTAARIDEVVLGPSGVHVVLARRSDLAARLPDAESWVVPDVTTAARAAAAVAALLPERYRGRVRPELCLGETDDVSAQQGRVLLASPVALQHTWRHAPRVLSTSEVAEISRYLDAGLEPLAAPAPAGRWWRRLLRRP